VKEPLSDLSLSARLVPRSPEVLDLFPVATEDIGAARLPVGELSSEYFHEILAKVVDPGFVVLRRASFKAHDPFVQTGL
jgi:hypothetical protein